MKYTEQEKLSFVIAAATVILPLLVGLIYLSHPNDGSMPDDWYANTFYINLVASFTLFFMALAGLLCCPLNQFALIRLFRNHCKKKWIYALNLINPVASVLMLVVSLYLDTSF